MSRHFIVGTCSKYMKVAWLDVSGGEVLAFLPISRLS